MKELASEKLAAYLEEAGSWAEDRNAALRRSRSVAWWVAGAAGLIAVLEAIALASMLPLKTVVPYTLLVDRQTGYVEALEPLERKTIKADAALTRSFLVQYVIARERFDIDSIRDDYRKVGLWSGGEARTRYIEGLHASNPESPLATLPRQAVVDVQVRSISALSPNSSLVRFTTVRRDQTGTQQPPRHWASVIRYRYSGDAMTAEDRLVNPLGFQVVRYSRDAETIPEASFLDTPAADYQSQAAQP